MKKNILNFLLLFLIISLTGCNNEKVLSSIPNNIRGYYIGSPTKSNTAFISSALKGYFSYELKDNTLKEKICYVGNDGTKKLKVSDCNFNDEKVLKEYDIKNIKNLTDENGISFELYEKTKKMYECKYTEKYATIYCPAFEGNSSFSIEKEN